MSEFTHLAMLKWRSDVQPHQISAAIEAIEALRHQIPVIRSLRIEHDTGEVSSANYDIALFVSFAETADVARFLEHPAHRALVRDHISVVKETSAVIQYLSST